MVYANNYPKPLHRLSLDIFTLENQGKTREQAVLDLAILLNMKPFEVQELERKGKSEEEAISEFLSKSKLSLTLEDSDIKSSLTSITRQEIFGSSSHQSRSKGQQLPRSRSEDHTVKWFFYAMGTLIIIITTWNLFSIRWNILTPISEAIASLTLIALLIGYSVGITEIAVGWLLGEHE